MLAALEMVSDKTTGAAFDPALKIGARVEQAARRHGLIARFIGDRIAFSPPLIVTEADIDDIATRTKLALDEVWSEIGKPG